MEHVKWIEIDLDAIRSNLAWARSKLGAGVRLMAVVKADAYGHGAVPVAKAAVGAGADCLGTLTVEEGLALRRAGLKSRIVLLAPPLPSQAEAVVKAKLEATVDSVPLLDALRKKAGRSRLGVHLDIDYGLGRWGVSPRKAGWFIRTLASDKRLRLAGLSTHLDYVAGKNAVEAEQKLRNFKHLADAAKKVAPDLLAHAANTSILLDFPHWQLDLVRVGNLLYGINPTDTAAPLKSPWKFQARIIALHKVAAGEAVGYANEYVAPKAMTVATVPVGYADGLTMEPVERLIGFGARFNYWGMLRGKQAPFVGRCAISHVMLDVSAARGVNVGDALTLPIRRTAASPRLPRIYR
ncbi:MAG: alanine racemase [Elusimicrobia bacterium]|nr:alanine racemase [Elusimicrobiota bacterium]